MLIIISPSLTMEEVNENYMDLTIPHQIHKAQEIVHRVRSMSHEEIKEVMNINDKIAELNKLRYNKIKFDNKGNPAILSYTGTVYKNIKANVFDTEDVEFCKRHVRILSGLYGVLRPYDSIYQYRLELKTKLSINDKGDLYEYFGQSIYDNLVKEDREILNLCSNEYSKSVIPYLKSEDKFITCSFKINKNGKLRSLATDAKTTRGQMVNFIVRNKIVNFNDLKYFSENGYKFNDRLSHESEYVFTK